MQDAKLFPACIPPHAWGALLLNCLHQRGPDSVAVSSLTDLIVPPLSERVRGLRRRSPVIGVMTRHNQDWRPLIARPLVAVAGDLLRNGPHSLRTA